MSGIFISYRREDSRADAGRLASDLKRHFGDDTIFRDIDDIEPGTDFVHAIRQSVGKCDALLAVVGANWVNVKDKQGRRRLDDPVDYVRLEIEEALKRNVRVVPVLVGDAAMPTREQLPASISDLSQRQAHELSDARWEFDVHRLAESLEKIPGLRAYTVKDTAHTAHTSRPPIASLPASGKRFGRFVGAAVCSAIGVLMLLAGLIDGDDAGFIFGVGFLGLAYWLFKK